MANPGKAYLGVIVTGAGVALMFTPLAPLGSLMVMYGSGLLESGILGDPEAGGSGTTVAATGTQGALPIVYGERKISHHVADIRTHGTDNSWLDMMTGICTAGESGKGIEGIEEIWFYKDEKSVSSDVTPMVMGNTNSSGQTDGVISKYYDSGAPQWYYLYNIGLGADSQAVDARMASLFTEWGVGSGIDHQEGRGLVTCFHGFFWDKREEDNVWARGRPTDIRYLVRGNLLFDPRYKTSGPDSDGWIWDYTDNASLNQAGLDNHPGMNPALQVLDLLTSKRYGLGIPYASRDGGAEDEIEEQSFIDGAIHCDEDVLTTGLSPNVTVPRYTSNVILSTGDSHKSNLERILDSFNGMIAYENGKFKLLIRKTQTAVSYEIDETQIIGELSVVREGSSVPNIITVRYPSGDHPIVGPGHDYELQSYTWPIGAFDDTQNAYLEADNSIPNEKQHDIVAVTDFVHAQHLAMTMLKELREDVIVECKVREAALQLSIGDVVNVTYDSAGWTQKKFRVLGMEILADDTVRLRLKEYDDSVYTLDPNADIPTTPGSDLDDPFSVVAPTLVTANCAAGYYLSDGVFVPRVEVTWTHSVDVFAHEEELVYRKDADTEWVFTGTKKKIADTAVVAWERDLEVGEDYWFGVVAWNRIGVRSAVAETAAFCTIAPPSDNPDDVTITSSDYTCLEGMTITFDNPAVYTDAGTAGAREIGFFSIEIREQGAGATELDRWNAGTFLETVYGTEWNYPFDKTTKTTYDLTLRRFDRFGSPATTPTEVQLVNNDWPCAGFGENEPSEYGKIIHNNGFENGGRWWYGPTGTAISATAPIAETYSLTITAGGAERWVRAVTDLQDDITLGVGEEDYISVEEGDYMFLAAWGETTGATATVRAKTYDKDKVFQANIDFFTFTSSTAERKKNFVYIPAGIEYVVVEFAVATGTGVAKFDNVTGYLFPPRIPTVKEIITYPTAASGKLEIEINSAQAVIISVEMKKYEDQTWDAGWTDVTPSPYDMTVTLNEKHPSAITYRVGYDLTGTAEGTTEYIENSVSFDLDTLPELATPSFDVDPDTGNVVLHWSGDDDVSYIKWVTTDTDWGTDALARTAAQGGTVANNRSGSVALSGTGIPIPESDSAFVAILAYTVGNIESIEVYRATLTRGASGIIVPTIKSEMDYSGSNGIITLVINDPQSRVTLVQWSAKTGPPGTAWGSWTTDTGPAPTYNDATVALDEKYDSNIRWQVSYTDPDGTAIIEGNVTFDVDRFPEIGSFGINIDADGAPTLNYHGDDDVNSIEWAFEIGVPPAADQPTATETRASTNYNSGSRSEGALPITGGTVAYGETIFVSFFAYTGVDDGGVESAILYECQETRRTSADTIVPTVQAQVTDTNEVTLVLNDPQDHINQVGFREYERNVTTKVLEWGSWTDTTSPYTLVQTLTRDEKHSTIVAWRVRYDLGQGAGNKYIENVIIFDVDQIPEINSVDVKVNDAGTVYLAFAGDDDCLSARYATSNSDFPTYATVIANDPAGDINATSGTNINIGSLAEGQDLFLSIAAYPQANQGGTANTDMGWGRIARTTDTVGGRSLSAFGGIKDGGDVFFRWAGEDILSVRYATNIGSPPSCPTGGSGGTVNEYASKVVTGLGPITTTQIMYICIVGYSAAGGTGDETDPFTLEFRQNVPDYTGPPNQIVYDTAAPSSEVGFDTGDVWHDITTVPWTIYGFDDTKGAGFKWEVAQGSYDKVAFQLFATTTPRKTLRLKADGGITMAAVDDPTGDETEITFTGSGAGTLYGLTDTNLGSPQDNHWLRYEITGTQWVNDTMANLVPFLNAEALYDADAVTTNVHTAFNKDFAGLGSATTVARSDHTHTGSGSITVRRNSGVDIGTRPRLNFIDPDGGVQVLITDDGAGDEIDINFSVDGSEVSFYDLDKVSMGSPQDNHWLRYEATGTNWTNDTMANLVGFLNAEGGLSTGDLGDLDDVTLAATPDNNEVLAYNGAGLWINQTAVEAGLASTTHLHTGTYEPDLGDPVSDGYHLKSTAAGVRSWEAPPSSYSTLASLTDTVITGPTDFDVLQWNGDDWVDRNLGEAGIAADDHAHSYTEDDYVRVEKGGVLVGTRGILNFIEGTDIGLTMNDDTNEIDITIAYTGSSGATTLTALTDTIITGPANNDILQWDGTADWRDRSLSEAGISAVGHNHDGDYSLTDHNHDSTYPGITHTETISGAWTFSAAQTKVEKLQVNAELEISANVHTLIDASFGGTTNNLTLRSGSGAEVYMQNGTETARRVVSVYQISGAAFSNPGSAFPYGALSLHY